MPAAEFKLPFKIETQILLVKAEDATSVVEGLAINDFERWLRIAEILVAILSPRCLLMRIFIAFKKVKSVDDIPIGNEEERALRAEIDPRHLSTRTEFSIETLNEKDVILVDGPDTRYGFIGEINPLLSGPRYDRFRENAVS